MAPGENPNNYPNWGKLAAIGLEVAVGVGLGVIVGTWIDRKYKTDPWGLMICTGLGFVAGMYLLFKEAMAINKNDGDK